MNIRIGIGTDIHRLVEGRPLIIGGVQIPYDKGLLGHSDGDVAVHAMIDAILGAAGLGDIGEHFPDSCARYKDARSTDLLRQVVADVYSRGFRIVNVDLTIQAERPYLREYKEKIRTVLSSIIGIELTQINVKAKTNEGLDSIGEGKAISAIAAVCLYKEKASK